MYVDAPIGLIPERFRRRPPANPAPAAATPEPPAESPEPAAETVCGPATSPASNALAPIEPPSRGRDDWWPPRAIGREGREAMRALSNAIGLPAVCDAACCRLSKTCRWARDGGCVRGMREQILPILERLRDTLGPEDEGELTPVTRAAGLPVAGRRR